MLSAVHLDSFSTSNCPTDLWNSRTVYFKYDIGVNLFLKTELEERRDCRILVVGLRRILMNSRVHNSCMRSLIGSILQITSNASADEVAKISAVSRKLVQPKRTIKQNVLRGKMSISTSG